MPDNHVVFDLDTPGDYATLQDLLQGQGERLAV
jgi:hypothetical protein